MSQFGAAAKACDRGLDDNALLDHDQHGLTTNSTLNKLLIAEVEVKVI